MLLSSSPGSVSDSCRGSSTLRGPAGSPVNVITLQVGWTRSGLGCVVRYFVNGPTRAGT